MINVNDILLILLLTFVTFVKIRLSHWLLTIYLLLFQNLSTKTKKMQFVENSPL